MMENSVRNNFRQTNAFAMQYGLLLGAWGLLSLAAFVQSFTNVYLSPVSSLMFLATPLLAGWMTFRFRARVSAPGEVFTLGRGFAFSYLTGLYAAVWIAAGVFVYLSYVDHGYVFDAYERLLSQPGMAEQLRQNSQLAGLAGGGELTPQSVVVAMRAIPPSNYAGVVIYTTVLFGPLFALVIGLVCRRRPLWM